MLLKKAWSRQVRTFHQYMVHFKSTGFAGWLVIIGLVVWLSGNALVAINEVTLRQARLIQGWVTVCGQVNHLGM